MENTAIVRTTIVIYLVNQFAAETRQPERKNRTENKSMPLVFIFYFFFLIVVVISLFIAIDMFAYFCNIFFFLARYFTILFS